ncbi:MAG: hypothetical protein ACHQ0Y_10880 [Thermodesulfovibrionales bacterium]
MTEKERPLPEPAKRAFGRKGRHEESDGKPLMADEIALAAAEGRLEDFLHNEVPDNDYARTLVSMMMGMTGMASVVTPPDTAGEAVLKDETANPSEPPEDVIAAVREGDTEEIKRLLQREHKKRSPGEETVAERQAETPSKPTVEKEVIENLVKIASDNDVSLDWLTLRALKLYVQEYQRTGRL